MFKEVKLANKKPLLAQTHDVDVKSLTRLAIHYDIALAMNVKTADALVHFSSKSLNF